LDEVIANDKNEILPLSNVVAVIAAATQPHSSPYSEDQRNQSQTESRGKGWTDGTFASLYAIAVL
jgi:hypothetical protein